MEQQRDQPATATQTDAGVTDLDRRGLMLFLVSLVIIGLRPLIQETHDSERQPFAAVLQELPEIGPLPTLWINLLIIGIFGFTMALRSRGRLP